MDLTHVLDTLDLKPKEAHLYLAALELGTASATDIAAKAGLQRTNFYDLVERLIQKGLIKPVKQGRAQEYEALDPEGLIAQEEQRLARLKEALPRLKAITNASTKKPKIYYYEGASGIRQIYQNMLSYHGEILLFTTPSFVTKEQLRLVQEHIPQRIAKKNFLRMIGELCPENISLQRRDASELRETRLLPKDLYNSNVEIGVYGNTVYIVDYRQYFAMALEAPEVAHVLKMLFNLTWNSGKIVTGK